MDIKIRKAELMDIELLMKWRMRVLYEVFAIPDNEPMEELERANRIYYQSALQAGGSKKHNKDLFRNFQTRQKAV